MEIDPERPKGQHLSPEIGQQPLGQSIRWPLWIPIVVIVAAVIFMFWAAGH